MTEVRFPLMSDDDPEAEGVVGTWFVEDGEPVSAGQVVAEVQVEKVSWEVEAPVAGTLRQLVAENVGVKQGTLIATID